MSESLSRLNALRFPGETKETHNRNIRVFLQEVAPLVARGTIQSIKNEVKAALAMPLDDSRNFAEKHFWALHESWSYVHWDNPGKPIPPERQAMRDLYDQLRSSGSFPFDSGDVEPIVKRESPKG